MISYSDYKNNINKFYNEEPFDLLFYRPIAYLIVKLTYRLPLTPNHFSFISFLTSISAGVVLSQGTDQGFFWGGIGIILFSIWDCCDGMLARMKQNGSLYGKYIDMITDLFANTFFFLGTYIGLCKDHSNISLPAISILICGVFILIHVATYQFYNNQLAFYLNNNPHGQKIEMDSLEREYRKLIESNSQLFIRVILNIYFIYIKLHKNPNKIISYDVDNYVKYNKFILPLWGIIAGSTHLTIFSIALITKQLGAYVVFALLFANLWAILICIIQLGVNFYIKVPD